MAPQKSRLFFQTKNLICLVLLTPLILSGCASIEGTRNKSVTLNKLPRDGEIGSLAILPIKENAVMPGLSTNIENGLYKALTLKVQGMKIIDGQNFGSLLAKNDLISEFGQWRAGYESTSILDKRPLPSFSRATDCRYFLLVNSTHLSREKIRAVDTGYSGFARDANNVWRADLKILAELIDTQSGETIWKGIGHAENISSVRRDIDLFFLIQHQKDPGVSSFISDMIRTATEGIASEIASVPTDKK
jgi:hypothetical protein